MKNKIRSTKKFVSNHKTALTITATATACFVVHRQAVKGWNTFLAEHDLLDEFYSLDEI